MISNKLKSIPPPPLEPPSKPPSEQPSTPSSKPPSEPSPKSTIAQPLNSRYVEFPKNIQELELMPTPIVTPISLINKLPPGLPWWKKNLESVKIPGIFLCKNECPCAWCYNIADTGAFYYMSSKDDQFMYWYWWCGKCQTSETNVRLFFESIETVCTYCGEKPEGLFTPGGTNKYYPWCTKCNVDPSILFTIISCKCTDCNNIAEMSSINEKFKFNPLCRLCIKK
jgi:hypothetical protein